MKTLISIEEIKGTTIINNNVDEGYLRDAIETAQTINLQQLIGERLYKTLLDSVGSDGDWIGSNEYYNLVVDYIQPYLKRQVLSNIIVPLNYKVRNEGILQVQGENVYLPSRNDAIYVKEHYENEASFYANRLSDYLCAHQNDFPEYKSHLDGELRSNRNAINSVLYLG